MKANTSSAQRASRAKRSNTCLVFYYFGVRYSSTAGERPALAEKRVAIKAISTSV